VLLVSRRGPGQKATLNSSMTKLLLVGARYYGHECVAPNEPISPGAVSSTDVARTAGTNQFVGVCTGNGINYPTLYSSAAVLLKLTRLKDMKLDSDNFD